MGHINQVAETLMEQAQLAKVGRAVPEAIEDALERIVDLYVINYQIAEALENKQAILPDKLVTRLRENLHLA